MLLTTPNAGIRPHYARCLLSVVSVLLCAAVTSVAQPVTGIAQPTDSPPAIGTSAASKITTDSLKIQSAEATSPAGNSNAQGTVQALSPQALPSLQDTTATAAPTATDPKLVERTHRFLSNYIGTWEGVSRMQTADGSFRNQLSVLIEYRWDKENPQVLVGTAIFATGDRSANATSRTYLHNGRLISTIISNGEQKSFVGQIDEKNRSIFWQPLHAIAGDTSRSQETFHEAAGGRRQLLIEGIENYRGSKNIVIQQQTRLTRTGD